MLKLERLKQIIDETSLGVKVIVIAVTLIGVLSGAALTGKSILAMPAQLAKHDSTTTEQLKILRKMAETDEKQLCISVADHRKQDWTLCYTNPQAVVPDGTLDANH